MFKFKYVCLHNLGIGYPQIPFMCVSQVFKLKATLKIVKTLAVIIFFIFFSAKFKESSKTKKQLIELKYNKNNGVKNVLCLL